MARAKHVGEERWLPGTGLVWMLPLGLPWLACFDWSGDPPARVYRILLTGTGLVALWLLIGLGAAWKTRRDAGSAVRRTILRAFPVNACVLGVVTLWFATFRDESVTWVAIAPCLSWLLCTFGNPYWREDAALVQSREPAGGWKSVRGVRLAYSDARDPVLWVRMRNRFPFREGIGYTPNLGHLWGRLTFVMLPLSALAGVALLVAGS